jgi:hypothetical protein
MAKDKSIHVCAVCGLNIDGFIVTDPASGAEMHPGCVPKDFKAQAKAERQARRASHTPAKKSKKIKAAHTRASKALARLEKFMALAHEAERIILACGEELLGYGAQHEEAMYEMLKQNGWTIRDGEVIKE